MAPFHVWSKVCIAPIHVRSKFADFASHMDGSNADFAPHMEGSHADFAPHIERRHSFRGKKLKLQLLQIFSKKIVQTTFILGVHMTYVNTFENKNSLRENIFSDIFPYLTPVKRT